MYYLKSFIAVVFYYSVFSSVFAQAGSIDTSFKTGKGTNRMSYYPPHGVVQNDGKIILYGIFTKYKDIKSKRLVRLNLDGSIDSTFHIGTGGNGAIYNMALQEDGKAVVSGAFTKFNEQRVRNLLRLNRDGSVDTTFKIGSGANDDLGLLRIQKDGKILVEGDFSTFNGYKTCGLVRLHPNGSVDSSFKAEINCRAESGIEDIAIQEDGKIIITGYFSVIGTLDIGIVGIARLNKDGSLDPTFPFSRNGIKGSVKRVVLQKDGKMIIGGSFSKFANQKIRRLARLNQNGTVDTTFDYGKGPGYFVNTLGLQSDGHIIVGGTFRDFNGRRVNSLAKIDHTGKLDTTFNFIPEYGVFLTDFILQKDNKIIVFGSFDNRKPFGKRREDFHTTSILRILNE